MTHYTPQEQRILTLLATMRLTAQELAELLGIQPRSAEKYLNGLATDGSITYEPHPDNERVRVWRKVEENDLDR